MEVAAPFLEVLSFIGDVKGVLDKYTVVTRQVQPVLYNQHLPSTFIQ